MSKILKILQSDRKNGAPTQNGRSNQRGAHTRTRRVRKPDLKSAAGGQFQRKIQDILYYFRRPLQSGQTTRSWQKSRGLRKGRYWLPFALIFIVLGIWGGGHWLSKMVESSGFFKVENSVCFGCQAVSNAQILEAAGVVRHQTNLFGIDEERLEEKLLTKIPWLESVEVEKDYPTTVNFRIIEKKPVAILHNPVSGENDFFYINRKGQTVLPVPERGSLDLPVLTGFDTISSPTERDNAIHEAVTFLLQVEKNENNPVLPRHLISELHARPNGELVCFLTEPLFPIFLKKGNMKAKYGYLTTVLTDLHKSGKKNDGKDMKKTSYILMNDKGTEIYIGMDA